MTRIVSLWGKGGVGKSTISLALGWMIAAKGYRVLVMTTDPMPSLSFLAEGQELGSLEILELSEEDVLELWKRRFGEEVYLVVSSLLPVGRDIIDYVASAPGVADQFILYKVYEVCASGSYDFVVWDLPAASEAIRLLALEKRVYEHLTDAMKLYLKVRGYLERLLRHRKRGPDELISEWRRLAEEIFEMLRSPSHKPVLVTVPEPLGVHQAINLYNELTRYGLRPGSLVVNMYIKESPQCAGCATWRAKAALHRRSLDALRGFFGGKVKVYVVPYLPLEGRLRATAERLSEFLTPLLLDVTA